jgi:hypothetical protein
MGGNVSSTFGLEDAIHQLIRNNNCEEDNQQRLAYVIGRAIGEIPEELTQRCSYRLLSRGSLVKPGMEDGRYISVNLSNYLLFRAPAYTDRGGMPTYDLYLIFPTKHGQALIRDLGADDRRVFPFAEFDCFCIGLYLKETDFLRRQHWGFFKEGCRAAAKARYWGERPSNIEV